MNTPRHGHGPIKMRLVDGCDQIEGAGDFCWRGAEGREVLVVAVPVLNTRTDDFWVKTRWTINHKNDCDAQWSWDGNREAPTLSPSLHAVGTWHGWVCGGLLVEA